LNRQRLRDSVIFAALWVPYALLTYHFRWLCDDAFISFRYARNWADGLGLRFNVGSDPPVEGYSNFLWTAFCALIELLGLDVTFWPSLVSFVCGSLLLYLFFRVLRWRCELDLVPACLATLALGCFPPFFIWSTSGLETMPYALLTFLTFERIVLRRDGPSGIGGGAAGLGLALIRAEGFAWSVLIGLLGALRQLPAWWAARRARTGKSPDRKEQRAAGKQKGRKRKRPAAVAPADREESTPSAAQRPLRPMLLYFAILCVGFAIYFVCRYVYYGEPLPNTVYAKVGVTSGAIVRGLKYVGAYFLTLVTPVAFVPAVVVVALRPSARSLGLPAALLAVASLGYSVVTGADFMTMWRFLVPGFVVFNAVLLGLLLHALWTKRAIGRVVAAVLGVAVIAIALLPAWDVHLVPQSVRERTHFRGRWKFRSEREMWHHMSTNSRTWSEYGKTLKEHTRPGDSCVLVFIGAVGYYSELYIYDMAGLVMPDVARREVTGKDTTPGHDKQVPFHYFLKDNPTILQVVQEPQSARGVAGWAQWLRRWQTARQTAQRYVVDFMSVELEDGNPERRYLVVLRRIEEGTSPAEAWNRLSERIRALRPMEVPTGGPAPP